MAILTTDAVIMAKVVKLRLIWHVGLNQLASISLEPNGISLLLRDGINGPFLAITDQESRLWFFTAIERIVVQYNQQRRFD